MINASTSGSASARVVCWSEGVGIIVVGVLETHSDSGGALLDAPAFWVEHPAEGLIRCFTHRAPEHIDH